MRRYAIVAALVLVAVAAWVAFPRTEPVSEETRVAWSGEAKRFRDRVVDPRNEERGALAGRVIDENAAPIPDAQVCASGWSVELSTADTAEPRCVKSDSRGAYRIGDLFAATWEIEASAPGRRPGKYRSLSDGRASVKLAPSSTIDGLDIVLLAGGIEVRGRVKDASGGVIAGARVSISSGARWFSHGAQLVTSDERGEFSGTAAEGPVTVYADAQGYATGIASGSAPGAPVEVLLTPESVLAGVVVDAVSKKPIVGARVSVSEADMPEPKRAITDAKGTFRIDGLQPGRYKPGAESPGRAGRALESVLLGLGETREGIVIEMHEARIVAGRVVQESGEPCVEGSVRLTDRAGGGDEWSQIERNGNVIFKAVLPSTYDVTVRCTGFLAEEKYDALEVGAGNVDGVVWKVRTGAAIRGIVLDDAGMPVIGARLDVRQQSGDPRASRRNWSTSAHDGTFVVGGLAPAEYVIEADAEALTASEDTRVRVDDRDVEDVRVTMSRGGSIAGEVVDPTGAPIAGASVRAAPESPGRGAMMRNFRDSVSTLDDGTFVLKGLAPGPFRVTAVRPGEPQSRLWRGLQDTGTKANVVAGQEARVRIVLAPGTDEIRGTIVDANGGPVADAFVDAEPQGDDTERARQGLRFSWTRQPALAGKDGAFVIKNLAAGSYLVRAFRRGGGEAIAENVKTGSSITLTLRTTGTLAGTVEMEGGGSPPAQFDISISGDGGFRRQEEFFQSQGRWILRDVPPGKYKVAVNAPEGTALVEDVELDEGGQREGIRLVLAARATVRGRTVDFETHEPVPGLMVFVTDQSQSNFRIGGQGGSSSTNVSDDAGEFLIQHAQTGEVMISVVPANRREYGFVRMPLSLAPGEDRDLGDIRVRKQVDDEGRARDGWLGFVPELGPQDATPSERRWSVKRVMPSSPAIAAGLVEGDVILKVSGQDVTGPNSYLFGSLIRVAPAQVVSLELERGDTISLTAATRP